MWRATRSYSLSTPTSPVPHTRGGPWRSESTKGPSSRPSRHGQGSVIQTPDGPVLVVAMQFYGRDPVGDDTLLGVVRVVAS
jgi:glycine/D-amino acid oxidase-like deaminating enzyme